MEKLAGFGLGYRAKHYREALHSPASADVDWFEIVSENFMGLGGRPRKFLEELTSRFPVTMHGVSLSIASVEPVHRRYLTQLKALADLVQPAVLSDHLCWTSHRGRNTHDLMPLPYTRAKLAELVERVDEVQSFLGRRLYLENPSAYVSLAAHEMDEASFLAELAKRSGCGLLVDVNNIYVCYLNLGFDPLAYLAKLPAEAIGYFHLAGHSQGCGVVIDTHDHPVSDGVWSLYREAVRRFPQVPTMVEWDDRLPEYPELVAELQKARAQYALALLDDTPSEFERLRDPAEAASGPSDASTVQEHLYTLMTGEFDPENEADERLAILDGGTPTHPIAGMLVYHDAYFLRLRDILSKTFPAFAALLEEHAFDHLVRAYLTAHPPTHYSVREAAAGLADYLASGEHPADFGIPAAHVADVLRLEWELERLYDVPDGAEPLAMEDLASLAPDDWDTLKVAVLPTIALLTTSIDAGAILEAIKADERPSKPVPQETHYVIYREDDDVLYQDLEARAHFVLSELSSHGSFPEACAQLAARFDLSLEEAAPEALQHLVFLVGLAGVASVAEAFPVATAANPGLDKARADRTP